MSNFNLIAEEIINKDKFQSLKYEPHHGLTRYDHVLRVAKNTYKVSKIFHLDYVSATRGALLHDYFNDSEYKSTKGLKKGSMHPVIALNNARCDFKLNKKEENIIVSHMFPMGEVKPNCKESWIVTVIDKTVALYECSKFKFREKLALCLLFIVNITHM